MYIDTKNLHLIDMLINYRRIPRQVLDARAEVTVSTEVLDSDIISEKPGTSGGQIRKSPKTPASQNRLAPWGDRDPFKPNPTTYPTLPYNICYPASIMTWDAQPPDSALHLFLGDIGSGILGWCNHRKQLPFSTD